MHAREAADLLAALRPGDPPATPSVVSAAASVVDDPECRAAMARPEVAVIWLHAAPGVLASRFEAEDRHRPSYGPDPAAFLADQAARREPLARALGATVIDTTDLDPAAIVDRVVDRLRLTRR
jgi:shikimate kinase